MSNADIFNLSPDFNITFQQYTDVCASFVDFIQMASINQICVPAFLAHGNGPNNNTPENYLSQMNTKLNRKSFFGLDTKYIFISLPIIDKAKMMDAIMKKVVEKNNEYRNLTQI